MTLRAFTVDLVRFDVQMHVFASIQGIVCLSRFRSFRVWPRPLPEVSGRGFIFLACCTAGDVVP